MILEFQSTSVADPAVQLFFRVPWEILAGPEGHLVADRLLNFYPVRRVGAGGQTPTPSDLPLGLVFMASAPKGGIDFDFEREEQAILQSTSSVNLDLEVEDSGSLDLLSERLSGGAQIVHLSCYGESEPKSLLLLEDAFGYPSRVSTEDLVNHLPIPRPRLIFLTPWQRGIVDPLALNMVRAGIPAVLGWDGPLQEGSTVQFAQQVYSSLGRRRSLETAVGAARCTLLQRTPPVPDWHVPRIYLGPQGGGVFCRSNTPGRSLRRNQGFKEFLDLRQRRVPIASSSEFVGRRRQVQLILRAFRDRQGAGVLIHGIGGVGKSSLAARIANRMPGHDTVVIYERYDALAVFEALRNALPPRLQGEFNQTWRHQVTKDASNLQNALLDMLGGPFRSADPERRTKPVLLIIDDLEQILETPRPGEVHTSLKTTYKATLASVIAAFRDAETEFASAYNQPLHLRPHRCTRRRCSRPAGLRPVASDGRHPAREADAGRDAARGGGVCSRRCRR